VHAQPGARHEGVLGARAGRLRLCVRARAVDGAANESLRRLLARLLELRPAAVRLERGHLAREKLFRVELAPARAAERLGRVLAEAAAG
jgi:uncharacterized protein YggU (UPF0235/DUF167 family)